MRAYVEGVIIANKLDENKRTNEKFRAVQIYQVSESDDAEMIKIKVPDLTYEKKSGNFRAWVDVKAWKMEGNSGMTIKLLELVNTEVVALKKTDVK